MVKENHYERESLATASDTLTSRGLLLQCNHNTPAGIPVLLPSPLLIHSFIDHYGSGTVLFAQFL
jgi:hypothetical protein